MVVKLNRTDKCAFCNKSRDWYSEIWLISNKNNMLFKVTVCEKCRKDPNRKLGDLYTVIPKLIRERN